MANLFQELKRRKVFQVAGVYTVVGWVLAQVAAFAVETFTAPQWVQQIFVVFLMLGFPLAILMAWAYELTPAGVRLDSGASIRTKHETSLDTKNRRHFGTTIGVLISLIIGIFLGVIGSRSIDRPNDSSTNLLEVVQTPLQLTANPIDNAVVSGVISPDGTYLAYADDRGLSLRLIESGETHALQLPNQLETGNMQIDWFPDGAHLLLNVVVENVQSLWKLAIVGGEPRQLQINTGRSAISPDGTQIAYLKGRPAHELHIMGPEGEASHQLLENEDDGIWELAWSPNSQWLLYGVGVGDAEQGQRIEGINVTSGITKTVLSDSRLFQSWRGSLPFHWSTDGRLIYAMQDLPPSDDFSNLWQIEIDTENAETSGEPSQITRLTGYNFTDLSMTSNGNRLTFLLEQNQQDVYVGELQDSNTKLESIRQLTFDQRNDSSSGWTADSTEVLIHSDRGVNPSLFRQQLNDVNPSLVSVTSQSDGSAEMSPDNLWILYWQFQDGIRKLMRVPANGGTPEMALESSFTADFHCPRSAGAAADCILGERDENNQYTFSRFDPVYGRGNELVSIEDRPPFVTWDLSPDGRFAAVVHNDGPVRVIDLETGAEREISRDGWLLGEFVSWTANGRGLVMDGNPSSTTMFRKGLVYVPLDSDEIYMLRSEPNQWHVLPKVSPDGSQLAFTLMVFSGNAWMIENP
jgi:Tol biopolymer transport system component